MRHIITTLLTLCCFCLSWAQNNTLQTIAQPDTLLQQAYNYLNDSPIFDPEKAISIYRQLAANNNPAAMTALGEFYEKGLGMQKNTEEAYRLYITASRADHAPATYLLGEMYRKGDYIPQNFDSAFICYEAGDRAGVLKSTNRLAYMYYKGLGGCNQDYKKAFRLFEKSKAYRNSMYFLGLLYRNGYGVPANKDSANVFLVRSLAMGEKQAQLELDAPTPENPDVVEGIESCNLSKVKNKKAKALAKTLHTADSTLLLGEYHGIVTRYDWSGTHILEKSKLSMMLSVHNGILEGKWEEEGSEPTTVKAMMEKEAIVFDSTDYNRADHYTPNGAKWRFENATLATLVQDNTVQLNGNLQLYSLFRKEPGYPTLVSLTRVKSDESTNVAATSGKDDINLYAYPNPFENRLWIEFTLPNIANVFVTITSMNGGPVSKRQCGLLAKGKHKQYLNIFSQQPTGTYVVTVHYGSKIESIKVIKEN